MRILYIQRGTAPPPTDHQLDLVQALSRYIEGDVLLPVWWKTREEAIGKIGLNPFPRYTVGRFDYHFLLRPKHGGLRARLAMFLFYIGTARRIYREHPFDCIVTYGFSLTALAGIAVKWITGAKLIFEVPSEPGKSYLANTSRPKIVNWLFGALAASALHIAAVFADRASLLYPDQLARYPLLRHYPSSVIHAFVPISAVRRAELRERYLLFVGYPWYLKGVDILIRAFRLIAADFPGVKLKIQGHFPDRRPLDVLIGDCSQIELLKARPYFETLDLIAGALVMVLPSRTEGMGRVLIEAMAAGRPCVGTAVGGIPHYIRHGFTGLLAKPEDPADLADKLRQLLSDEALREQMAVNAFEYAHQEFSEEVFARKYRRMLELTTGK